jgi:glucosamine-6-phosphate deaminase
MRIVQATSKIEAEKIVATIIFEKMETNPSAVIGLATGNTMIPVYAELVNLIKKSSSDFSQIRFFMLDEYLGLPDGHPSSFKHYIRENFIKPSGLDDNQVSFPPAHLDDGHEHYERLVQESGGIDIQLLGIGKNGHVGFNEPGSLKTSSTSVVTLSQETLTANRNQFVDDLIPKEALTMGIGTILKSKSLLMLATGNSKASAIKHLLNHHDDPECPATYLKDHSHFILVLDPEAASRINLNI